MRLYPGDIGIEPRLDAPDEGPCCQACGSEVDVANAGTDDEPWWLCPLDRDEPGADEFYGGDAA